MMIWTIILTVVVVVVIITIIVMIVNMMIIIIIVIYLGCSINIKIAMITLSAFAEKAKL